MGMLWIRTACLTELKKLKPDYIFVSLSETLTGTWVPISPLFSTRKR